MKKFLSIIFFFSVIVHSEKVLASDPPDTTKQKSPYDINDPRNPDCPCHKLQKQADDEFEQMKNPLPDIQQKFVPQQNVNVFLGNGFNPAVKINANPQADAKDNFSLPNNSLAASREKPFTTEAVSAKSSLKSSGSVSSSPIQKHRVKKYSFRKAHHFDWFRPRKSRAKHVLCFEW